MPTFTYTSKRALTLFMTRNFPYAWFVLAALAVFTSTLAHQPLAERSGAIFWAAYAPQLALNGVYLVTVGLVYMLVRRHVSSGTVAILAWVNLASAFISQMLSAWLRFQTNIRIVEGERIDGSSTLVPSVLANGMSAVAALSLVIVLLVVLVKPHPPSASLADTFE